MSSCSSLSLNGTTLVPVIIAGGSPSVLSWKSLALRPVAPVPILQVSPGKRCGLSGFSLSSSSVSFSHSQNFTVAAAAACATRAGSATARATTEASSGIRIRLLVFMALTGT